jgi:Tfp pilus assembly protein PilF
VDIDTPSIISQENDYKRTISFCEQGKFSEAKPILKKLIEKNPTNSEYHRIMGQILSDEGNQEEAINCLIDSLRWDSKNSWALLMMGNIFAKFKNDISTAMKYYDQSLIVNPKDNITINNIGANLMQQGNTEEAKKYFLDALKINTTYPNTHFALGMIAEIENDLQSAFYSTIKSIKLNKNKDVLYSNSLNQAIELSKKIISTEIGKQIFKEYKKELEKKGDKKIDIKIDNEILTAAKFEFAENYDRDNHTIKYKSTYPAVEHLIMHELVHLDFALDARKENSNQLFVSTQQHKNLFNKNLEKDYQKIKKMGLSETEISEFSTSLFEGMNLQVYNTPIDLFIENFLYNEYSELRPFQFISLFTLLKENLNSVTNKKVIDFMPPKVVSNNKIYNVVNAMLFKDLFGVDLINDFKSTVSELNFATKFYNEFLEYKDDKSPAEEYELLIHWAEDLDLDKYFDCVNEQEYRTKNKSIDSYLEHIAKDPFDIESEDPYKKREMKKFQEYQESIGTNMAVVMFMLDALRFFEEMQIEEIKKIAFEIALQGAHGYFPERDGYRVNSIKNKTFSGYHILAYYYVSWSLAMPEVVHELQLPFIEEYKIAYSMHKP